MAFSATCLLSGLLCHLHGFPCSLKAAKPRFPQTCRIRAPPLMRSGGLPGPTALDFGSESPSLKQKSSCPYWQERAFVKSHQDSASPPICGMFQIRPPPSPPLARNCYGCAWTSSWPLPSTLKPALSEHQESDSLYAMCPQLSMDFPLWGQ